MHFQPSPLDVVPGRLGSVHCNIQDSLLFSFWLGSTNYGAMGEAEKQEESDLGVFISAQT